MSDELVQVEAPAPGVVLIRFNRPDARNALSVGLREAAAQAIRDAGRRC